MAQTGLWTTGGPHHVPAKPFWLCAGDYPCVPVIYKAPLFSPPHTVPPNVRTVSFSRDGFSQLCPSVPELPILNMRSHHKEWTRADGNNDRLVVFRMKTLIHNIPSRVTVFDHPGHLRSGVKEAGKSLRQQSGEGGHYS